VLSTLHTNDAPSALVRLLDLGVASYLVASTVEAVLGQRLVRKVCPACRRAAPACPACRGTGYRGRTGIYELLVMTDELRDALPRQRGAAELRDLAVKAGMRTLRDDGRRLVEAGVTTPEEVARVTGG
jgi:type II secretory ATPase GspE/PulE/Tfp pilus assembly ATPase PilB-like protein